MSGYLVHVSASITCPHGGKVSVVTPNLRVRVGGQAVGTVADKYPVAACTFQVPVGAGTKPQPCVTVEWSTPALRVRVSGQAVILQSSSGVCRSTEKIPQGLPKVAVTQVRVRGT